MFCGEAPLDEETGTLLNQGSGTSGRVGSHMLRVGSHMLQAIRHPRFPIW